MYRVEEIDQARGRYRSRVSTRTIEYNVTWAIDPGAENGS